MESKLEEYVTKPIYVVCYEADKPRLIAPESFFIYGGQIKYKHVEEQTMKDISNKAGVMIYKLILSDVNVKTFDIIYQTFQCQKYALDYWNNFIDDILKANPYKCFIDTSDESYIKDITDNERLAIYNKMINLEKIKVITKTNIARFIDQFNIPIPQFLKIGQLTYDENKDLYTHVRFMIFDQRSQIKYKPYTLFINQLLPKTTDESTDDLFKMLSIPTKLNLDPNSYFLNGLRSGGPHYNRFYYNLDYEPTYIYRIDCSYTRGYPRTFTGYQVKIYKIT
jgi:hypothetical protein